MGAPQGGAAAFKGDDVIPRVGNMAAINSELMTRQRPLLRAGGYNVRADCTITIRRGECMRLGRTVNAVRLYAVLFIIDLFTSEAPSVHNMSECKQWEKGGKRARETTGVWKEA